MADGTTYSIDIEAQAIGVESSVDQVNALASQLDAAGAASTQFDAAIARTQTLLAQASAAYASAADAVASGEAKYSQLEMAATRAAKAVEKASLAGKDTSDLQAKATAAAAAVKAEASALEELKAKAAGAKSSQEQLAKSLATLEGAAKKAAAAQAKSNVNLEEMTALAKGSLGPMGGIFEKATLITKGLKGGGLAGAAIAAAAGFAVLTTAIVSGYLALATFAVTSNKAAMDRLNKATEKARDNFGKLFSGVRVDQFVAGVEKVLALFDESTNEATALKTMLSALLNPLFDQSGPATSVVVAMFRGMILGALKVTIAVVKLRNALRDVVPESLSGDFDSTSTAFKVGEIAAYALAAGLVALAAVGALVGVVLGISGAFLLALFVVPIVVCTAIVAIFAATVVAAMALVAAAVLISMALVLWPFILLGLAIYAAIAYFDDIKAAVLDFAAAATSAAGSLIDGLVGGITSGAGAVYDAIRGLAAGAIGTLKSALGIHSPSTVFALQGSYTAEGFVEGIEGAQGDVDAAVGGMVQTPDAGAGQSATAASTRGGHTFSITINAPSGDADDIASSVRRVLTDIFEGDLLQLGASEPEPST